MKRSQKAREAEWDKKRQTYRDEYEGGMTLADIARKHGTSRQAVHWMLSRMKRYHQSKMLHVIARARIEQEARLKNEAQTVSGEGGQ